MCDCPKCFRFQTRYHTLVCTNCGIEIQHFGDIFFINTSYTQNINVVPRLGYSRKKRFSEMLSRLIIPTVSAADNNVFELLGTNKYSSIESLYNALRVLPVKDKRYSSLHLFSKYFLETYIPPPPVSPNIIRKVVNSFDEIDIRYKRLHPGKQLINYNFLLLHFTKSVPELFEYKQYLKPMKSNPRIKKYNQCLDEILTMQNAFSENYLPALPIYACI